MFNLQPPGQQRRLLLQVRPCLVFPRVEPVLLYSKEGGNTRVFEETVQSGYEKIYDQEVEGFGGFIYCFRIPDKEKYFPETTHKITAKFCYRILGFDLFKEKSVKIN